MTKMFAPRRILITGASGGLGGAIARHYVTRRRDMPLSLSLWGRDGARLDAIAAQCRESGAQVDTRSIDLADIAAVLAALEKEDAHAPFDLAVFASGRGDVRMPGDAVEAAALVARLGTVNFTAPAAMAACLGGRMAARGNGRLVLVGSAAAFHALPFAAAYSGTKAGLARFADALRIGLAPCGVTVTLASPGFIDTPAGRKVPGPKPMLMPPDAVAARIAAAVARGKAHAVMPWFFVVLRWFDRLLPRPLRDRLLRSLAPPG